MPDAEYEIREARPEDAGAVAELAGGLALSFAFRRDRFEKNYAVLLGDEHARLLVAAGVGAATTALGYLLGFEQLTFYANGPVGWVEEVYVTGGRRASGVGRALMGEFERWAAERGCALVALATRRAAPFYRALGYEESATYFRKILGEQP